MLKRSFDLLLAAGGMLLFAPLAGVIAALIKLEDGGPVFFAQDRVGAGCRVFRVLKFRSMIPDAERETGPVQAAVHDTRVTRVGHVLRGTAMDELPQLWSILKGDMSFVGPRPLRPGERHRTAAGEVALADIPGYVERHRTQPGLTGVAQVYAARDLPPIRKFRYDLLYQRRASFCLDLSLIVRSVAITVLARWDGSRSRRSGRSRHAPV
jgi:lipopolysaccharide/colanic/teichoic acid biosynthesis glycosyltransferase